jgi:hypothetical protein
MAKPFHIHADSVAHPLSVEATAKKYGASPEEVEAIKKFVHSDSGPSAMDSPLRRRTAKARRSSK